MGEVQKWADQIVGAVEKVFFGKHEVIEKLLAALLCRGHVLLEDVPGLGKTILSRAIAAALGGQFSRIQCTPDLLPADVIGVTIFNPKTESFMFRKGPILGNIILVDEINRATPRTQSALLEAMAENQVTVEGKRVPLPDPFFLMATENPVEFEGTFPLPEAQKDRFLMALSIGYPTRLVEEKILESQKRITHPVEDITPVTKPEEVVELQKKVLEVHMDPEIRTYLLEIVEETRKDSRIRLGVSPRGSLALYKASQALAAVRGRDYVIPEDVKELTGPVFSKRIILKSEFMIKGFTPEQILADVLERASVPVMKGRV